jgi:hypothetical protein
MLWVLNPERIRLETAADVVLREVGASHTCRNRRDGLPKDKGGDEHANLCVDEHAHR